MATRHGWATLDWLLKRGWSAAPLDGDVFGDQAVVDPVLGDTTTVYEAARRHRERTGDYPPFLKDT